MQHIPRLFIGVHYATYRQLSLQSVNYFDNVTERSLLRGLLLGTTWTALRAYHNGMRTSPICPFCNHDPEDEEHAF